MTDQYTYQILNIAEENWDSFIDSTARSSIFHHSAWVGMLAECYGYRPFVVAICDDLGDIQAGLPMMEVNSMLTGFRWISLPFTDHCSPMYDDNHALQLLTKELVMISKDKINPHIGLRTELPPDPSISTHSDHVLHTLILDPDPNIVFNRIHHMHRRNIKKAQKNNIRIEKGVDQQNIVDFYKLHLNNRRRQGMPVQPKRFFNLLRKKLLQQGMGFVLCAYIDEECIAAYIFLHLGRTLTYKYGASNPESLDLRPNNLLMWEGIRWGCENGYRVLDLGRTSLSNTGLRDFKSRWGAEETPLVYSTISTKQFSSPNEKMERLMRTIIRNAPLWVCQASGELLYKHFA